MLVFRRGRLCGGLVLGVLNDGGGWMLMLVIVGCVCDEFGGRIAGFLSV